MTYQYQENKEEKVTGRYITNNHIKPLLDKLSQHYKVSTIGKSVLNKPIYAVEIGTGKTKVFMWSQMHGNESTTTKALFDAFNFLKSTTDAATLILESCTLLFIPILNPDGAELYTRENANNIDLNRDAIYLSQPESIILRQVFDSFQPDFCFNLHDQRTIYAAGETSNPASVSFLAPAYNKERDINASRNKAISLIVSINEELQKHIPNQIGRFDDTYNGNCVGDTFQSLLVPTILFEAGHFQKDYQREETRKFIFIALITALKNVSSNDYENDVVDRYLTIPQNFMHFNDFIIRNVQLISNSLNILHTFAIDYEELLEKDKIIFKAVFSDITENSLNVGHTEMDANNEIYTDNTDNIPKIGEIASFSLNNKLIFEDGFLIK